MKTIMILLKHSAFLFIALTVSAGFCSASDKEYRNVSGYVTTRTGQTITFTGVHRECRALKFIYGPEEKTTIIPLARISKITFGEGTKTAFIVLKNGRELTANSAFTCDRSASIFAGHPGWGVYRGHSSSYELIMNYFDDIEQKEQERTLHYVKVSTIVIGDAIGRFGKCPHCRSTWPDHFLFCPHTTAPEQCGASRLGSNGVGARHETK